MTARNDSNGHPLVDRDAIGAAYATIRSRKPWTHRLSNILHSRVLPFATLSPWLNDADFLNLYERVKGHTLVDIYRCYELWTLAKQTIDIEGNILEVGVWRGGTGAVMAHALANTPEKIVFLADTFTGVVKAGDRDTNYKGGEHADTSIDLVRDLMKSLSIINFEVLQGIFPEDTQHMVEGKISMLHCDVDVYSSSKDIVEWCLPRLSMGSMIVFDDYGFFGCEGVTKFCDEFRQRKNFRFMHNLNGHAIFIKIA
jgi:O-methyltransferase